MVKIDLLDLTNQVVPHDFLGRTIVTVKSDHFVKSVRRHFSPAKENGTSRKE